MFTIGLIGGIASGKTAVAKLLAEQGAEAHNADLAAKQALDDPQVREQLLKRWGQPVFNPDGALNREAVAQRVFGPEASKVSERQFLESLIHPLVRSCLNDQLTQSGERGAKVVVLDVPLLLEAGWDEDCDLIVFVDAPREQRLRRALDRGWDEEQLTWREAAQLPISEKRGRAKAVIVNDATLEVLKERVEDFWRKEVAPLVTKANG